MARTADFPVGPKSCDACPCGAWAHWSVDVEPEVLEQFPAFCGMDLSVATNVMNGLGNNRRRTLHLDQPPGLVTYGIEVRPSTTNCLTGVLALNNDFTVAGIEVNVGDFSSFRNYFLNQLLCIFFTLHDRGVWTKDYLSLDPLCYLSNQALATAELFRYWRNDGNVSCFEFNRVGNVLWDDLGNLIFQFFKC